MQTNELKIDMDNLKKLLPIAVGIGAVLAVMISVGIYFGGLWGLLLTLAWAFCGGYYTETALKSGVNNQIINLGINGAILAAIAATIYDVLSGIIVSMRSQTLSSIFSVSLVLQAAVVGALAAIVWSVYKSNKS